MRKRNRLLLAAATTTVAVTGAVTGVTAASASPGSHQAASGTEYVQIVSASTTPGPASAIARGVFTAAGQARLGDARIGTIVFPGGTIVLSHHADRGTSQFDPRTCLSVISQAGTYRIAGGTGRYAGISGHGTYQLSLEIVAARAHGDCSSAKPPVAQQELLRLSGPVRW
jgi:hypothetical protein